MPGGVELPAEGVALPAEFTRVVGHAWPLGCLGLSSAANVPWPAEQMLPSAGPEAGKPLGPSTLCGSHWMDPHPVTVPFWHTFCRLTGRSV
ncbi:hypothetical protein SVIOM342S_06307 [Streptomyces violaceorubidus]